MPDQSDPLHPGPEATHTVSHEHLSREEAIAELDAFLASPAMSGLTVEIQDRFVSNDDPVVIQKRREMDDALKDQRKKYIAEGRKQIREEVGESLDEPVDLTFALDLLETNLKGALHSLDLLRKAYEASDEPAER